MDWFENDALFIRECKTGHAWEQYVALFFHLQGLKTQVLPQGIRATFADAEDYKHLSDVMCEGVMMEVKSRNVAFHTPEDFPHPTIFIDTVSGWNGKSPAPKLILCVSQQTGALIWLPANTKPDWTISSRYDRVRNITDSFYESAYGLWQPIETLLKVLRELAKRNKNT